MAVKVIIFLAIVLALTIGTHMLFYKAVVRVFAIAGPALKTFLFIALLLLALSFMASFFLLQWQENHLTVGFYKFSAIWVGLFLSLLPAALASWIIIAAFRTQPCRPAFSFRVSDETYLQRLSLRISPPEPVCDLHHQRGGHLGAADEDREFAGNCCDWFKMKNSHQIA